MTGRIPPAVLPAPSDGGGDAAGGSRFAWSFEQIKSARLETGSRFIRETGITAPRAAGRDAPLPTSLYADQLRQEWQERLPADVLHPSGLRVVSGGSGASQALVAASVAASLSAASIVAPSTIPAARFKLAARASARDTGLSNPAYLAATSGTQFLRVQIESARVKFTFSDPVSESLTPVRGVGGKRGEITELSEASRARLANRAWALSAEGYTPEAMITLTSPANWERVYICDEFGESLGGGRLLKQHQEAFRKRLGRFLARFGVAEWSALWFLEFQQRGAPHIHLMLFGCNLSAEVRKALRSWCGVAWSSIVGNPDKHEQQKHKRAGTKVERMRKSKHFGYAVKYATKTEQKEVPHYFRDVGRFWGCWNYTSPEPVVLNLDYSRLNGEEAAFIHRLVHGALREILTVSVPFYTAKNMQVNRALNEGIKHKQGFTVFGESASQAVLSVLSA